MAIQLGLRDDAVPQLGTVLKVHEISRISPRVVPELLHHPPSDLPDLFERSVGIFVIDHPDLPSGLAG
jgi:hypothetical protein